MHHYSSPSTHHGQGQHYPQSAQHYGSQAMNTSQTTSQYGGTGTYASGNQWGSQMQGQHSAMGQSPSGNMMSGNMMSGNMMSGMQGQSQMGSQMGSQQSQTAQFGAHEVMEVHEVLSNMIEGINRFGMYRQFVRDSQLQGLMENQLRHMNQSYNNIVSYLQNKGTASSMPYHGVRKSSVQYGLRNPASMYPSTNMNEIDDRDVALGMLSYHKCSAIMCTMASLECADNTLRRLMQDAAISCSNQAWECFAYMNQRGMYQVPTMMQNTTNTMIHTFQ